MKDVSTVQDPSQFTSRGNRTTDDGQTAIKLSYKKLAVTGVWIHPSPARGDPSNRGRPND